MTKEQREAIDKLNKDKKCSLDFEGYITIVRVADLNTALSLIKELEDRINYLENNRKQVKEQFEAAQTELSFAIDMLTDI